MPKAQQKSNIVRWQPAEALMLAEKYKDLFPEFMKAQSQSGTNAVTNKLNKELTVHINNHFHNNRQVKSVVAKLHDIKRKAKEKFRIGAKEREKTGGGKVKVPDYTPAEAILVELVSGSIIFEGLKNKRQSQIVASTAADRPSCSNLVTNHDISNEDSQNDALGSDDSENEDRAENEVEEESGQDDLPNISDDHGTDEEREEIEETIPNVTPSQASGVSKRVQSRREASLQKKRILDLQEQNLKEELEMRRIKRRHLERKEEIMDNFEKVINKVDTLMNYYYNKNFKK